MSHGRRYGRKDRGAEHIHHPCNLFLLLSHVESKKNHLKFDSKRFAGLLSQATGEWVGGMQRSFDRFEASQTFATTSLTFSLVNLTVGLARVQQLLRGEPGVCLADRQIQKHAAPCW